MWFLRYIVRLFLNPLNPQIFGEHTSSAKPWLYNGVSNYVEEFSVKINPDNRLYGSIRYPCGTYANYVDNNTDLFDRKLYPRQNVVDAQQKALSERGKPDRYDLDNFIQFATQVNAQIYFPLNVYTQSVEECIQAIERVKSKTSKPICWELGNELSSISYRDYSEGEFTVHTYVDKVTPIIKHIRQYPKDKIGVCGQTLNHNWPKIIAYIEEWAGICKKLDFDAVIMHPYAKENQSPEELIQNALHYQKLWNKPLWFTEWGNLNPEVQGMERAIFVINFLRLCLQHNIVSLFHTALRGDHYYSGSYNSGALNANGVGIAFFKYAIEGMTHYKLVEGGIYFEGDVQRLLLINKKQTLFTNYTKLQVGGEIKDNQYFVKSDFNGISEGIALFENTGRYVFPIR